MASLGACLHTFSAHMLPHMAGEVEDLADFSDEAADPSQQRDQPVDRRGVEGPHLSVTQTACRPLQTWKMQRMQRPSQQVRG